MNPYPYSGDNKRYQTFAYWSKRQFGGRLVRIPLDAGFTCPNKDGTCGTDGCSYCASGSAASTTLGTIEEQYAAGLAAAERKWAAAGTIPYLQANSNTYAPPEVLADLYRRCAALPGARMLAVGTRADCLAPEVIAVLEETARAIPLLVELGMQSARDDTLALVGRGYGHEAFLDGYARLDEARKRTPALSIGIHLLNGLPGEDETQMIANAREAARLRPDHIKLHTLCVLRGTRLAASFASGGYVPLTREDAVRVVCRQLAVLPPETVIDRLCADAPLADLIAPLWVRDKTAFRNAVDTYLAREDLWQGSACGV